MKTIVIFGATGTVGTYTSLFLKEKGYNVIAVGKRNNDNNFFNNYDIKYYSLDITNLNDFDKLPLENVNSVIHLAGIKPSAMKDYMPKLYIDSILNGTFNVLTYCLNAKVEKIIFSHSRADSNYLMGKKPIPSDIIKKFPLTGDHSIYTICKNAAVDLLEHFYHQYGLKRFILRLPTIYAYHPNLYFYVNGEKKMMAYRFIIEQAIKGETIEIWGDPTKAKEIVYVKDLIQIIEKCIESPLDGGMYNVGRGVGITLDEQIKGIVNVFSNPYKKSDIIYRPDMPNAREFVNDISKTQAELSYHSLYSYHDLLIDYKKHLEEEPYKLLWGSKTNYT